MPRYREIIWKCFNNRNCSLAASTRSLACPPSMLTCLHYAYIRLVGMGMPLVHDALKRSTSESPLELHSTTRLKEHDANSSSIHLPPAVLEPRPGPMEHATPKPNRVGHLASFVGGDEVDVNRFGACLVTLCRQYCPGTPIDSPSPHSFATKQLHFRSNCETDALPSSTHSPAHAPSFNLSLQMGPE